MKKRGVEGEKNRGKIRRIMFSAGINYPFFAVFFFIFHFSTLNLFHHSFLARKKGGSVVARAECEGGELKNPSAVSVFKKQ